MLYSRMFEVMTAEKMIKALDKAAAHAYGPIEFGNLQVESLHDLGQDNGMQFVLATYRFDLVQHFDVDEDEDPFDHWETLDDEEYFDSMQMNKEMREEMGHQNVVLDRFMRTVSSTVVSKLCAIREPVGWRMLEVKPHFKEPYANIIPPAIAEKLWV